MIAHADQLSFAEADVYDLQHAAERVFTIQARFERFHRDHPEVYAELLDLCRAWKAAGNTAWSIKGAFEVLRWKRHTAGLADPGEAYRLNNNYTARYARLIVREHPEFAALFELRELTS